MHDVRGLQADVCLRSLHWLRPGGDRSGLKDRVGISHTDRWVTPKAQALRFLPAMIGNIHENCH